MNECLVILVMAICAALFWWGGYSWKPARRFILPCLLTLAALLLSHNPWCLTTLSCMGVFCMGYGDNSPLRHVLGDGWGRSVWGLLAATCLSLPLFLTHHLGIEYGHLVLTSQAWSIGLGMIYLTLNFTLENALKSLNQKIGDPLIGLGLASILLIIH